MSPCSTSTCPTAPAERDRAPWPGGRMDSAMHVSGHRVETAVWSMRNPANGRTVTLVGTMHIGAAAYFRALSSLLERLAEEGVEIHVEGIGEGDGDMTETERAHLKEAEGWADPESAGAAVAVLDLESQGCLELPAGCRNVDLSRVELLRRVGWRAYRRLLAPGREALPPSTLGPVVRTALRLQLRYHRAIEWTRALRPRNRRVNRVVVDERNHVAFAGACSALSRTDVALVWGTEHLPGLARLFRDAGYRPLGERWLEACSV